MRNDVLEIQQAGFDDRVLHAGQPVVLDSLATGCPPGEFLAPRYEAVAVQSGEHVRFLKIKRQANRDLATRLDVTGSPTPAFFKDGQETGERLTGEVRRRELKSAVTALVD